VSQKRLSSAWEINHLIKHGLSTDTEMLGDTPVEYISGHAEFRNLDILVNESVLIPRMETEKIVDLALNFIIKLKTNKPLEIADIGCGSGALGIALAKELSNRNLRYHLTLSDISPKALKITRLNVNRLLPNANDRISIFKSDLLCSFPNTRIDCLVSNLPYIPSSRIPTLNSSVKNYEPLLALDGGPSGTDLVNKLLRQVETFLTTNPVLILEVDYLHRLKDFSIPPHLSAKILKDDFGNCRYLVIKK